jgi:membrane protease subunit HflK
MQQIYTNVTKVMVDTKSNSQLLYLPLDKLMQQSAPAPAAGAEAAGSSGEASRAKNDSQSPIPGDLGVRAQREADIREAIRNRDRGAR